MLTGEDQIRMELTVGQLAQDKDGNWFVPYTAVIPGKVKAIIEFSMTETKREGSVRMKFNCKISPTFDPSVSEEDKEAICNYLQKRAGTIMFLHENFIELRQLEIKTMQKYLNKDK